MMLLSSAHTRFLKITTPVLVLTTATVILIWVRRHELFTTPGMNVALLLLVYACAAWVLWRPFGLRVADHVEEKGDALLIRRGNVEVVVPYAEVIAFKFLPMGGSTGVKLTFATRNALGAEIGFYLDESTDPKAVPNNDPGEHLERQLERYRHGRAAQQIAAAGGDP